MRSRPATRRVRLRTAFGSPGLRRCQLVVATTRLVETAVLVAVSVELFARGGPGAVAAFGIVTTLAPAIGMPVVTGAAGRTRPARVLAACLGGTAVSALALTIVVATDGPVAAILATAAVGSTLITATRPLVTSLLPTYIQRPEELVATNTAAAGVENLSRTLGPLAAGVATATLGPTVLLAGVTVALASVALASRSLRAPAPSDSPDHVVGRMLGEVLDGLRTLTRRGPARLITVAVGVQTFVRGALNVIVVSLALDHLGLGEAGVGLLLGAVGLGGFLGIPVAVRAAGRGHLGRTLLAGLVLWGLPLVGAGATTNDPVVLALLGVVGIGNTLLDIATDTLLQRTTPPGRLTILLGAFEATLLLTMAAGAGVAGVLVPWLGAGPALAVLGALLPVVAACLAPALVRLDGSMRDRDAGVALLQLQGIFSPLVLSAVDQLSGASTAAEHAPGEEIIRQGETGDRFYVIEEGEVAVIRDGHEVDRMRSGDCFGEVALIDDRPRNATVVARTPTRTRSLSGQAFLAALHSDGRSREAAEQLARARRHDAAVSSPDEDRDG